MPFPTPVRKHSIRRLRDAMRSVWSNWSRPGAVMGSACLALVKERSQRATSDSMEGDDFCVYLSDRLPDGDRLLPLRQYIAIGHI